MKLEHNLVNTLYFIVTFIKIASGEVCYGAEFSEDISACPDFENNFLNCDTLQLGMVEGKEAELGLNGKIDVFEDIVEGTEMSVDIWKVLEIGKEYLYHMQADLCQHIKDEGAPWYPMVESMKIFECPIIKDSYDIKDMSISLNHSQVIMNHEMIGDYIIQLSMLQGLEKLSCYELTVTVTENNC